MRVRWYGQSAFSLTAEGHSVFIDPFGDFPSTPPPGRPAMRFAYPSIAGVSAELLLITHEHFDHNAADHIGGSPRVIRSTAGTLETPLGTVIAIASEHDAEAGTRRGPNTIFVFELGGVRVCHFGDFGQAGLRPAQAKAIGRVDLLLLPVGGGGATVDGAAAAAIAGELAPRWVVPMHYRTPAISFLEPADAFLGACGDVRRLDGAEFETAELAPGSGTVAVVPAPPPG